MLLRRVIEHVTAQNWTAVALDFVIVVTGVFIGIQVSNWNAARNDRASEQRVLELLFEEAQNNVAYSKLIIYRATKLQTDREAAEAKLRGIEPAEGDEARGLASMTRFRDLTPIHAAYDELANSGDITLIRHEEVRRALSIYNGVVIFHDRARREYIDDAPDIMQLASGYMNVAYDSAHPLGYTIEMDWDAAAEDRALVNAVNKVMGDQVAFNERREIIVDRVQLLCDAIGEALEKPCAPPDWVGNEIRGEPYE